MLVLSRKREERIHVTIAGVEVWITVVQIEHGKVRIGFTAPKEVIIMREELLPYREKPKEV